MCLVGIKLKNTKMSVDVIELIANTAQRYKSGFGYAFKRENESVVHFNKKVKFSANDVFEEISNLNLQDGDEIIWHGRAATHGEVTDSNAHPYIIGEKAGYDNKLTTKGMVELNNDKNHKGVFVHNGIFHGYKTTNSYLSDTYNYGVDILNNDEIINLIKSDPNEYGRSYSKYGWARLAFLFPDVGIRYTSDSGNWVLDKETNLLFSNGGYGVSKYYDIGGKTFKTI